MNMNRVKELTQELTQNGKFGEGHRENIFSGHIDLQKFAEFIVQECIDQVTWKTQKERIIEHMQYGEVKW
jgi:hypothetical protein